MKCDEPWQVPRFEVDQNIDVGIGAEIVAQDRTK